MREYSNYCVAISPCPLSMHAHTHTHTQTLVSIWIHVYIFIRPQSPFLTCSDCILTLLYTHYFDYAYAPSHSLLLLIGWMFRCLNFVICVSQILTGKNGLWRWWWWLTKIHVLLFYVEIIIIALNLFIK